MTKFLIHKFIPRDAKENTKDRQRYGVLSGVVGILCNLLLCVLKFICGTVSHSVSITADAANNLSDASSNIVTVIGAKIASKPVDNDHPFGHGRMEYISALIVDFFIFLMGFELGKSSIEKIIHPQEVRFSAVTVAVLVLSIGVKLWMAYFNQALYKESNNLNLKAVRQDSLNDCISTAAAGAALLLSAFTAFDRADGIMGLLVAAFILAGGVSTLKDIMGPLLGQAPSKELVDEIERRMLAEPLIVGVHDLTIHDYGPGRVIASAHAEVPADQDIMAVHNAIDRVEHQISKELQIVICIHMDPIAIHDATVDKYRKLMAEILQDYDPELRFHDFRLVECSDHMNLIMDIVVPKEHKKHRSQILKEVQAAVQQRDPRLRVVAPLEPSCIYNLTLRNARQFGTVGRFAVLLILCIKGVVNTVFIAPIRSLFAHILGLKCVKLLGKFLIGIKIFPKSLNHGIIRRLIKHSLDLGIADRLDKRVHHFAVRYIKVRNIA